jgi:hypothetical protein
MFQQFKPRKRVELGVPRVIVRTRKEHSCTKCCSVINAGARVYGITFETDYKGYKLETRLYTVYYCNRCKPVEAKM